MNFGSSPGCPYLPSLLPGSQVQIKTTQENMAAMDQAEAEATALRQKEHEEYAEARGVSYSRT